MAKVYDLDASNFELVHRYKYGSNPRIKNAIINLNPIKKGDVVFQFADTQKRSREKSGYEHDTRIEREFRGRITGYVDNYWYTYHAWPNKPMWYMVNHSFNNPNLKLQFKNNTMQFVAMKDIPPRTVLTFKYEPTRNRFGPDSPRRRATVNIRL